MKSGFSGESSLICKLKVIYLVDILKRDYSCYSEIYLVILGIQAVSEMYYLEKVFTTIL